MEDDLLKEKLLQYMTELESGIRKAGEFTADQVPEVVHEFIMWEIVGNAIPAISLILIAVAVMFGGHKVGKQMEEKDQDKTSYYMAILIAWMISMIVAMPSWFLGEKSLKAYFAPRVVVLEKIAEIIK